MQNSVPIVQITYEWTSGKHHLSCQQLPLQLCYALTIYKSQGQTPNKAVTDLGKAEMAAGSTYVAVSRLKRLEDGLFQPMTYMYEIIGQTKRLLERKKRRILSLSSVTTHFMKNRSCAHKCPGLPRTVPDCP